MDFLTDLTRGLTTELADGFANVNASARRLFLTEDKSDRPHALFLILLILKTCLSRKPRAKSSRRGAKSGPG